MRDWFAPLVGGCDALASELRFGTATICIALAALLIALIALGFGPLRAWLSPASGRRAADGPHGQWEGGLLAAWRLYRRTGTVGPRGHQGSGGKSESCGNPSCVGPTS